jgi:hypothetical protein
MSSEDQLSDNPEEGSKETSSSGSATGSSAPVLSGFNSVAKNPYINMQKALETMFPYYREIIEPLLTSQDIVDNNLSVYNSNMRRNITSKYFNLQIPVYGFTVTEPKLISLKEAQTYGHYIPMYNYYALNGIQVPDKIYASNVRIPIMADGGFATTPEVFPTREKANAANMLNTLCFVDGLYLADYLVIPKDRLVKVLFTDKNYEHGRIIGMTEFPTVLAESIQKNYPNLQIPFQGLLGVVGSYGTTGPHPNCPGPYRLIEGLGCGSSGFKYSDYPLLQLIGVKEGSICTTLDRAKNATIIAEEVQKQIPGNFRNIAVGAIINAIFESSLKSDSKNNTSSAAGLFQLLPGRGEGVGFMKDSTGIIKTRKRELGLSETITQADQLNPRLNAAYTISRFKQIPGILNATSPQDATDKIIRLYEKPSSGDCLTSESNGRLDSIKYFFN